MEEEKYEPNQEYKEQYVESQLKQLYKNIYEATVTRRVANKCDDKELLKRATESLIKLEKMKDELNLILAEILKETTK